MAYNEGLAQRMREHLPDDTSLVEKKMFGGVGFMFQGNMACGIYKDELIVRVNHEDYEEMLTRPHIRPFDITGRPMRGWIMVGPEGYASDTDLRYWVDQGLSFASSLPPKG